MRPRERVAMYDLLSTEEIAMMIELIPEWSLPRECFNVDARMAAGMHECRYGKPHIKKRMLQTPKKPAARFEDFSGPIHRTMVGRKAVVAA